MRDHGGNLDAAIAQYGAGAWIDLSTGINRRPYPLPPVSDHAWRALPTATDTTRLIAAARAAWGVAPQTDALAVTGAQAAIQMVPMLRPMSQARVFGPTYNEHAACLRQHGWQVQDCHARAAMAGAGLAVIVNPNNPDGQSWTPEALLALAANVGFLVVDESFADVTPELSLLPHRLPPNVLVLRSFGKFYGLAGLRLGFAFGASDVIARMRALAGPWPVAGPALEIGGQALQDTVWADAMRAQLAKDAARADDLAARAGWAPAGGTVLFRLYQTQSAPQAQAQLARHHIWSRIFPWSDTLIRLGLPGQGEWDRLDAALS